jgi:hypothetical protein
MNRLTTQQRGEVYARTLHDLTELTPIMAGVPNILGMIYGARMCDRALKVMRAFDRLIIGLEDALPDLLWQSRDCANRDQVHRSSFNREFLRAEAGDPPINEDEIRCTMRRFIAPPLSLAEHRILGAKMKAIHNALIHAICELGNAGGKRRADLISRVRKVERILLTLRSHLDNTLHREHPTNDAQWLAVAAVYFGSSERHLPSQPAA